MTRHPAHGVHFDDLLSGLEQEVSAGTVATATDGQLTLYKYTETCAFEKRWTPFSLMARGLILDVESKRVVATTFEKFFNHGESSVPGVFAVLPDEPFTVTEKVDGSLGIIFWHDGRWRVATRGSFKSTQAQWAQAWLKARGSDLVCRLIEGHTYLAEIIYPENRIVVPYDFDGLVLLGAYDHEGYEYSYEELAALSVASGVRVVGIQHAGASLDDLLGVARTLTGDQEGFVVRFASGLRIKIKGDEYCRIHKLVSRVTPIAVWEAMLACDDMAALERQLPEEFAKDFREIHRILTEALLRKSHLVSQAIERTSAMNDKDLGLYLQCRDHGLPADVARWVFPVRKHGMVEVGAAGSVTRRRFFDSFRPTGNRLDGYSPSSAMNRFSEEVS